MASWWDEIGGVLYGGIRPDIPGHGGEECARYLTPRQMIGETLVSTAMMITVGVFATLTYTMPKRFPKKQDFVMKKVLLVALCLLLGIEAGFKLKTRQLLYLLNPCHIITMMEIYLLSAQPGRLSFSVLRTLVHYVYGAMVAMVLPETLARGSTPELASYWMQHGMIYFIVPPYLIYIWGPEVLEPLSEWAWSCFAGIVFGIHHHYILQPLALITHVNLNFILCPALMDPFHGPYYRAAAIFHQTVSLLTHGKLYTLLVKTVFRLLPKYEPEYEQKAVENYEPEYEQKAVEKKIQ